MYMYQLMARSVALRSPGLLQTKLVAVCRLIVPILSGALLIRTHLRVEP
jgi:hypothetical protein